MKINSTITAGTSESWSEMVEVRLPKAPKTEQNFQFVGVNGKTFQVPKGKTVKVPKPVAEVLTNAEAAKLAAKNMKADWQGITLPYERRGKICLFQKL